MPIGSMFARGTLAAALCSAALLSACDNKSPGDHSGSGTGRAIISASCQPEIEKLCSGEARLGQCLRRHKDELSATCNAALADRDRQK